MEEANATMNPLSLMDSSGVTPKGVSRQPSLVCFVQALSASLYQLYMLVCWPQRKPKAHWCLLLYKPTLDKGLILSWKCQTGCCNW